MKLGRKPARGEAAAIFRAGAAVVAGAEVFPVVAADGTGNFFGVIFTRRPVNTVHDFATGRRPTFYSLPFVLYGYAVADAFRRDQAYLSNKKLRLES